MAMAPSRMSTFLLMPLMLWLVILGEETLAWIRIRVLPTLLNPSSSWPRRTINFLLFLRNRLSKTFQGSIRRSIRLWSVTRFKIVLSLQMTLRSTCSPLQSKPIQCLILQLNLRVELYRSLPTTKLVKGKRKRRSKRWRLLKLQIQMQMCLPQTKTERWF